ncbi:hypothetical protein [Aminobacter niigataensis]|uniref:hypothetical protein n=1 Tax=Aminobacter niigataensis TaxID=83265 RepID=UPI00298F1ADD|nr:hypothetical protein [Aminobacter niigataensis]
MIEIKVASRISAASSRTLVLCWSNDVAFDRRFRLSIDELLAAEPHDALQRKARYKLMSMMLDAICNIEGGMRKVNPSIQWLEDQIKIRNDLIDQIDQGTGRKSPARKWQKPRLRIVSMLFGIDPKLSSNWPCSAQYSEHHGISPGERVSIA